MFVGIYSFFFIRILASSYKTGDYHEWKEDSLKAFILSVVVNLVLQRLFLFIAFRWSSTKDIINSIKEAFLSFLVLWLFLVPGVKIDEVINLSVFFFLYIFLIQLISLKMCKLRLVNKLSNIFLIFLGYLILPILFFVAVGALDSYEDFILNLLAWNTPFAIVALLFFLIIRGKASTLLAKIITLISLHLIGLINILLLSIKYYTGFEFNPLFLIHMSWHSVKVATSDYYALFLLITLFIFCSSYIMLKSMRVENESQKGFRFLNFIALLGLLFGPAYMYCKKINTDALPLYAIYKNYKLFKQESIENRIRSLDNIKFSSEEKSILKNLGYILEPLLFNKDKEPEFIYNEKFNLILIYLEAFQANFVNAGGSKFKNLTPNLDRFVEKSIFFTSFYNSVTPTVNALISSQCGLNITIKNDFFEKNLFLQNLFGENIQCLSDHLHDLGYYQVAIKGAPMNYTSQGPFLKMHKFDETLGLNEFNKLNKYEGKTNGWGLHDTDLVEEALGIIDRLNGHNKPFNLTMMTVNSHSPGHRANDCPVFKENGKLIWNPLLNGIHCTDFALGKFFRELEKRKQFKNTAILVVGDHTQFKSKLNKTLLGKHFGELDYFGKVFMALRAPNLNPAENNILGFTPDVAPTALEILGFRNIFFPIGKSLLSERKKIQRLVAQDFEVEKNRGKVKFISGSESERCSFEELKDIEITLKEEPFTSCERYKMQIPFQKLFIRSFR